MVLGRVAASDVADATDLLVFARPVAGSNRMVHSIALGLWHLGGHLGDALFAGNAGSDRHFSLSVLFDLPEASQRRLAWSGKFTGVYIWLFCWREH